MKARRQSQPALILDAMHNSSRELYTRTPQGKTDLSYYSPRRRGTRGIPRRFPGSLAPISNATQKRAPISLYNILSRYIETITASPWAESELQLTQQELAVLDAKGYSQKNVKRWVSCLRTENSVTAAEIFRPGNPMPPLFLVLLFLQRKRMKTFALGIVLRHVELRLQLERVSWKELKILVIRMIRHARRVWPESIPWIASVFTSEATRIFDGAGDNGALSANMLSDVTHFSNAFLSLLSLPASLHPILSALHQEKAQFQVLHFMASRAPALIVTRTGFRAVVRNQLAHKKTLEEREWAKLKRESWPPWKENRNAMDEEKGYEFGTSRASRILHRTYEAGYEGRRWENIAKIYSGWDTDSSPTIQTRTSLPDMSVQYKNQTRLETLLWAGRVRTTRTRREAWACFLEYEASGAPARQEVYRAMFEKLYYPELEETEPEPGRPDTMLLPGDSKEVLPDPSSPLTLVYLNEPIPSFEQLYYRMADKGVRPTNRFLAYLVQTSRNYAMVMRLLESAKDDFGGGIRSLLEGSYVSKPENQKLPGYMSAAFIHFLCYFGRFTRPLTAVPPLLSGEDHKESLNTDRHYLLEYAHAILLHCRPHYRPAWTVYMRKVVFDGTKLEGHRRHDISVQYRIIGDLVDKMKEEYIDLDDEQFRLVCLAIVFAAQHALRGDMSKEDTQHVFTKGAREMRTTFHTLVSANLDTNSHASTRKTDLIPPHIPAPTVLHVYVRALGILRDYEGLYSFATWAASHHAEITARANAQHSGPQALFRTIVALRAGLEGVLQEGQPAASKDLVELIRVQIESIEEWDWPSEKDVERYKQGTLTMKRRSGGVV